MIERRAVVVGGGIGGLATAVALGNRGWSVEVFERTERFAEVGAGLSLWPNALRALDVLGVGDQVRSKALVETEAGFRDASGRWLSRTDTEELARRYGPLVMIHRADLHDTLREALAPSALRPGTEVTEIRPAGGAVEAVHRDGVTRTGLVVGADGIRSVVRRSLWRTTPEPRYAGYTAWRMIADPGRRLVVGGETWGRGERFGIAPMQDGRVYAFATAGTPAGARSSDGELTELRARFGGWHEPIPDLLKATAEEAVLRHDIVELPPLPTYVAGRIALLGDAAHAMTPNMGQGACQALEDAVALASALDEHDTVPAALVAYDAERRPRTQWIARRSRQIGAVAQWRSTPGVTVRDALLRLTPDSVLLRSLAPVLSWSPPA